MKTPQKLKPRKTTRVGVAAASDKPRAFESIKRGLEESLSYVKGHGGEAIVRLENDGEGQAVRGVRLMTPKN